MDKKLVKIGITQGDTNGIGLELIIRTFLDQNILKYCIPVIYANTKAFAYYKKLLDLQEPVYNQIRSASEAKVGKVNLVPINDNPMEVNAGVASKESGLEAILALDKALEDAKKGDIDALLTAPLDKHSVSENREGFTGHTGYIAKFFGVEDYVMLLVCEDLKVALATDHVAVTELSKHLSIDKLVKKMQTLYDALRLDFGITKPRIAVLGLNPHAGDGGLLGKEETDIIKPAIAKVFADNKLFYGPYPADSFFGSGQYRQFDAVLAMYHDQGLIPFKTFAFFDGVNCTAGLPIVRTSPDHGTAYDLVGKGTAETLSFRNALYEAIHIVHNRKQFEVDNANPLPFAELRREKFRIDF